jgi:D-serine deaminase-like pyridoxal phosphate-dependent protein
MGSPSVDPDRSTATVERPTLLIHRARAERNIAAMAAKAASSGVGFRPHFKTHQSIEVGRWFRSAGVEAITVSSPDMAVEFAADGWEDILIAVPLNAGAEAVYRDLSERVTLGLLVDHPDHVGFLQRTGLRVNAWIKIDAGYGRVGVAWDDRDTLRALALGLTALPHARFAGLLAHSGQTYQSRGRAEMEAIWNQCADRMWTANESAGRLQAGISVGDTPSCSMLERFDGCTEVRPGNFVYYDLQQLRIGSCGLDQIAAAVACPIVSVQPRRNEVVVHGGSVHFSRDFVTDPDLGAIFGRALSDVGDGWGALADGVALVRLSQEHGVLTGPPGWIADRRIGDVLRIVPAHSCLAASALRPHFGIV